MFTRKHVGPVNCASCEKGITNLLGQQADYLSWKRLPFREPAERIAKYGQGFSKILTMMRPTEGASSSITLHGGNHGLGNSPSTSPQRFALEEADVVDAGNTRMSPQPHRKMHTKEYLDSKTLAGEMSADNYKKSQKYLKNNSSVRNTGMNRQTSARKSLELKGYAVEEG